MAVYEASIILPTDFYGVNSSKYILILADSKEKAESIAMRRFSDIKYTTLSVTKFTDLGEKYERK